MSNSQVSSYMPASRGTIRGWVESRFRSLAYLLWKRELNRLVQNNRSRILRVVDIGCGPGFLLESLRSWFPNASLTGVDASEQLLAVMSSRCKDGRGLIGDACSIPLPDASEDVVFCLHVVEHLANPQQFFSEARRVLRPKGLLVMATPNLDGLGAKIMKENWIGYSDSTHISLHGAAFWRDVSMKAGFTIRRDGTTGLSGIPAFRHFPLGLLQRLPILLFGFFPWSKGEAYICVAEAA
jgi:SAM-dependent methyltransferase